MEDGGDGESENGRRDGQRARPENRAAPAGPARRLRYLPRTVWTPGQLRAFLETARRHRLFALFHLAAYTGARRGELLRLRWRDVDLDGGGPHHWPGHRRRRAPAGRRPATAGRHHQR